MNRQRTPIERARLLAARLYPPSSPCRRGIRAGQWDGGQVVRQYLIKDDA